MANTMTLGLPLMRCRVASAASQVIAPAHVVVPTEHPRWRSIATMPLVRDTETTSVPVGVIDPTAYGNGNAFANGLMKRVPARPLDEVPT